MKILHLPTNVGGNAIGLSMGQRRLGQESTTLALYGNYINYQADIQMHLEKSNSLKKALKILHTFLQVRSAYDIYHFNFGTSLVNMADSVLRKLDMPFYSKKAKLFVTYNGCDARQKYVTMQRRKIAACFEANCYSGMCNSGHLDEARRRSIKKVSRYAKHIWAMNPDLLQFLPPEKSSFLPYTVAGWYQLNSDKVKISKKPMIIHAPTNAAAKGTKYILQAIDRLKQSHADKFQFQLLDNLGYLQALEAYRKADIIIDQLLIGWYGATAVEAMKLQKAVVVRIEEADLQFIDKEMAAELRSAVIDASPETLYSKLCHLIEDHEMIRKVAEAGHKYVNRWHDPEKVAQKTIEVYSQA